MPRSRHASLSRRQLLAGGAAAALLSAQSTGRAQVPALVPVTRSDLVVERGGYRVNADSPGTSLLVLPIEYSHCLRPDLISSVATRPRLLRANLAMAAILFTAHIEGTLLLRYGPLSSACRMEDWREADALHIGGAREWPTP